MKRFTFAVSMYLCPGGVFAQQPVIPADVAGMYFTAADGFETRVVHPKWDGDRLVVEDIRFRGQYPLIAASLPPDAVGAGVNHPAAMMGGILVYEAPALFGGGQPQAVVFNQTKGPATAGIHAIMIFEGPEGMPSTFQALMHTTAEWTAGQNSTPGKIPD